MSEDIGPEEIALVSASVAAKTLVEFFEKPWWKRRNRRWAYTNAKVARSQLEELTRFNMRRRGLVPPPRDPTH